MYIYYRYFNLDRLYVGTQINFHRYLNVDHLYGITQIPMRVMESNRHSLL